MTVEPMHDLTEIGSRPLWCLWLTRMCRVPPDAGDLTYSFYLLSSLSRAGARLTVLARRRTDDRAGRATDNAAPSYSDTPAQQPPTPPSAGLQVGQSVAPQQASGQFWPPVAVAPTEGADVCRSLDLFPCNCTFLLDVACFAMAGNAPKPIRRHRC